jgi:heme/copper-type cytochrome/quinol oxidase subunit 2
VPVKTVVFASLAIATELLVFFLLFFCARHSFRHLKAGFHAERDGGRLSTLMVMVFTVVPILIVGVMPAWLGPYGALSEQIL